jgi:hypothetical protein
MNNLELLNANGLDESISNANGKFDYLNYDGENFSNGEGGVDAGQVKQFLKDNPDAVKKGAELLKGLAGKISEARKTGDIDVDSACKKPLLPKSFLNEGKWNTYEKCKTDIQQKKAAAVQKQREFELEKARLEAELASAQARTAESSAKMMPPPTTGSSDKFLGMPKAVGITVTIVGGLALIIGGILLVRKLRK